MSNILRLALKYSVKRFGINYLKVNNNAAISRTSPCFNQLLNNTFYTDVPYSSHAEIEKHIEKLDLDARRNGRISLREVENVIKEIKLNRSASSSQSAMVIRCCGSLISEESPEKRTELVQEVWNTLEKLGIDLDISHYNALLRVYLENEYQWVPSEILAELEQKGLEPNKVTYTRLISRYCQLADIEGATRILQFMREKDMSINEVVFNALILGHSRANDMGSAEEILNIMKQAGQKPSPETYTLLACGYVAQGNMNKVESILEDCERKDIPLTTKDHMDIVYHMCLKDLDIDEMLSKIRRNTSYNQESINCIYKLISAGKIEHAYKIVKSMVRSTRSDGTLSSTGGFFVSALVRNDRPSEEIIKYCDKLVEENLNVLALNIAMENSLRYKKESLAFELFRAAKERNVILRPHYFWPLLVARGEANDLDGVYKVLSSINAEFNVPINTETVREYVVPFALKQNIDISTLMHDLKSCGVSTSAAVSSVVIKLVTAGRIREAAEIASSYTVTYSVFLIGKPLVNSYLKTLDADSFTTLLKQIAAGIQWKGDEEETEVPEYRETVGKLVLDVVKQLKTEHECKIKVEEILRFLQEKGVGLSSRTAEEIQTQLRNELTQEISTLLEKLTAVELTAAEPATAAEFTTSAEFATSAESATSDEFTTSAESTITSTDRNTRFSLRNISDDSAIRMYENAKAKGEVSKSLQKKLFNIYGRKYELEKLLELKEEMEKDNFVLTNGMYTYIIDSYVEHEKLDDAWQTFQSRCENEPDFVLNPLKMLKFALLAVKNEQYDKAHEVLSKKALIDENAQTSENSRSMTNSRSWRILNHFAEKGDVEKVKQYFDLIVNNGYCTVNNILLGPLIKVHLVNNDLEGALNEFENCCTKYRVTPFKAELSKRCIEAENASSLQRITDLSTEIHGEINSLYDLMLSFLECGRLKQAKQILETPGVPVRQDRLHVACQKYQNSGSIEHLENLLAVTKNIGSIDRSDLYYNLLLAYDKADEPQKAMSLWLQLQEEDRVPTDTFLALLAEILQRHNMPVSFDVPTVDKSAPLVQRTDGSVEMSQVSRTFRKLLNDNKIDEAVTFKNRKLRELNDADLSLLSEALLKHGRYDEAKEVYEELQMRGVLPMPRVLKYFSINAMMKGDIELLENIKSRITEDKMHVYLEIDNRLGKAYMESGRAEEYLNTMEKELDSINSPVEMESYVNCFPIETFLSLLLQSTTFLPQVERIANKCLEKDSQNVTPISALWMYHLNSKNYGEAEKLWSNYLQNSPQPIQFKALCNRAAKEGDVETLQALKGFIERKVKTSPKTLGIIYGSLIKVLVSQDKVSDAVQVLEEASSKIEVENIMRNALETLKAACISRNIPFNYAIPAFQQTSRNERRPRNENNAADSDLD
ncbi:leucine-rich PPR motif-containing protein, mitochondrial-like [Planococcus citri]|uniref:leucine-rich PPR motif-containing protein, mitochondrial-like n=1 Tax=Planococcus citri TaxID=170843 RepID=UPI0031F980CE